MSKQQTPAENAKEAVYALRQVLSATDNESNNKEQTTTGRSNAQIKAEREAALLKAKEWALPDEILKKRERDFRPAYDEATPERKKELAAEWNKNIQNPDYVVPESRVSATKAELPTTAIGQSEGVNKSTAAAPSKGT